MHQYLIINLPAMTYTALPWFEHGYILLSPKEDIQ